MVPKPMSVSPQTVFVPCKICKCIFIWGKNSLYRCNHHDITKRCSSSNNDVKLVQKSSQSTWTPMSKGTRLFLSHAKYLNSFTSLLEELQLLAISWWSHPSLLTYRFIGKGEFVFTAVVLLPRSLSFKMTAYYSHWCDYHNTSWLNCATNYRFSWSLWYMPVLLNLRLFVGFLQM